MACTLFGGVGVLDPDFADTFRKFVASCIAEGRHPKTKWLNDKELALYCCESATDPVSLRGKTSTLEYELTLPGRAAVDLFEGEPVSFAFGAGRLELTYTAPDPAEVVCLWKGEKYSVGSIVKQDDGKCHRCQVDGTWALGVDCS